MGQKLKILAIDDDQASLQVLCGLLTKFGYETAIASSGIQALDLITENCFDLIISDMRMPEMNGIDLLCAIRERDVNVPFIIVTACGSIESAVLAVRYGAYDYLEKPYHPENLRLTVQRALDHYMVALENQEVMTFLQNRFTFQNVITDNPALKKILEMASKVSTSPHTTVAIYGESGTGKEVLARAIHYASKGLPGNYIAVNCAAIPETLLESELFGHVRGAFTGADKDREGKFSLARGGTLFLDEIGDMPLHLQAKLLRVLEERTYERIGSNNRINLECRVIVATHRNLLEMAQSGAFREDLYHRINVVSLNIPPLRERIEDLPILVEHFLGQFRQHLGKHLPGISKKAFDSLSSYSWPGNIRELRNVLERAAIMVNNELIRPEHFCINANKQTGKESKIGTNDFIIQLPENELSLEAINDRALSLALERCKGNKSQAATLLKVNRKCFYR